MNYYRLDIDTGNVVSKYHALSELLEVIPATVNENEKLAYSVWSHSVENSDEQISRFDFINNFLDILEPKFPELEKLKIERSDITIWFLYEYDQQCNMEFNPNDMKRLGENGITLCISCWQK